MTDRGAQAGLDVLVDLVPGIARLHLAFTLDLDGLVDDVGDQRRLKPVIAEKRGDDHLQVAERLEEEVVRPFFRVGVDAKQLQCFYDVLHDQVEHLVAHVPGVPLHIALRARTNTLWRRRFRSTKNLFDVLTVPIQS